MSDTSIRNPTSPIQHKDIRSASLGFKRDKDHSQKWSMGQRPSYGVTIKQNPETMLDEAVGGGNDAARAKVRPNKPFAATHKPHANKVPKPHGNYDHIRTLHKADALVESNDPTSLVLSKSLLELLPTHVNNTNSAIQTAIRTSSATDSDILYSFDNKGPSPGSKGRSVDLGGLVELAEKKWDSKQTERMVKVEYEVLDEQGETTVLSKGKGKKGSPKTKAVKNMANAIANVDGVEEDDGFMLI